MSGKSQEKKTGTNLGRSIVIHEKRERLARNIGYPDIVKHLGVIEWNFAGDYDTTRMRSQKE
jgi:hypothetical protein